MARVLEDIAAWADAGHALTEGGFVTAHGVRVPRADGEDTKGALDRHRQGFAAREKTRKVLGEDYVEHHAIGYEDRKPKADTVSRFAPLPHEQQQDVEAGEAYGHIKRAIDAGHINYRTGETYANAARHGWMAHHDVHQRLRAHRVLAKAAKTADSMKPTRDAYGKPMDDMGKYYAGALRDGQMSPMKVRALAQQALEQHHLDHGQDDQEQPAKGKKR